MSMNFLNNGIGPSAGGCNGQSPKNCSGNGTGCCATPGGYLLNSIVNKGSFTFNQMNNLQKSQWLQKQNYRVRKNEVVKVQSAPSNGIGVI